MAGKEAVARSTESEPDIPEEIQSKIIQSTSIQTRADSLPPEIRQKLEQLSKEGKAAELFALLSDFGLNHYEQTEFASHFMKEFKEGIRCISWTKERLAYTTAILEHTLKGEDKVVTSANNMIRNYLIFHKIFEHHEGKLPRFGQFKYAMEIFRGVNTIDDIYQRIAEHRTFGEFERLSPEDLKKAAESVSKADQEVVANMIRWKEREKDIQERWQNAVDEEEQSKGTEWSVVYSKPQEYVFPNYQFQTGPLKGKNHVFGRSSWEPMFMAFIDVANTHMEQGIRNMPGLTDEQKEKIVAERRIELLYEPFDFPVDIKKDENGKDRAVIYRLDFVDINRWRGIEIKGPLTPKAAEKIRLFQKYYVEGDFADVHDEKKALMIRYVEEAKTKVAQYCKEHGYPVRDRFSHLDVFGAHRWDWDLNNFNDYRGVRAMDSVPKKTRDALQHGLMYFLEKKIDKGDIPDIRPEGYFSSQQLPELIDDNIRFAKKQHRQYIVEKPYSLKPFSPGLFIKEHGLDNIQNLETLRHNTSTKEILRYVLDTLPVTIDVKAIATKIENGSDAIIQFMPYVKRAFSKTKSLTHQNVVDSIHSGRKMALRIPEDMNMKEIARNIRAMIGAIEKAEKLIKEQGLKVYPEHDIIVKYWEKTVSYLEHNYIPARKQLKLSMEFFETPQTLPKGIILDKHLFYYRDQLLGKYKDMFYRRGTEIIDRINELDAQNLSDVDWGNRLRRFKDLHYIDDQLAFDFSHFLGSKTIHDIQLDQQFDFAPVTRFLIEETHGNFLSSYLTAFKNFIETTMSTSIRSPHALFSQEEYNNTLEHIEQILQTPILTVDESKKFCDAHGAIVLNLIEIALRNKLGDKKYKEYEDAYQANKEKYWTQEMKAKLVSSRIIV